MCHALRRYGGRAVCDPAAEPSHHCDRYGLLIPGSCCEGARASVVPMMQQRASGSACESGDVYSSQTRYITQAEAMVKIGVVVLLGVALSACSSSVFGPSAIGDRQDTPILTADDGEAFAVVGWIDAGRRMYVTTWGSSSCPTVPTDLDAQSDSALSLTLKDKVSQSCTEDLVPTTYALDVPVEVSAAPEVQVTIRSERGDIEQTLRTD
jgi:hypothetical protein